jgi:NitT/TauT family transport system ATP-binding protein
MRLRCSGLSVEFGPGDRQTQALSGVSFDTREGEFLSIVGPSGCGKTTLLRALAGLIAPQEGRVERLPSHADVGDHVLLVFQERNLFPWMTAIENATFGLEMQGVDKGARQERAMALFQRFGLRDREGAYPHELSAGMKQRVAVMRAFLSEPDILLMDEPFGALDFQTRLTLQQELLGLWEEDHKSVIFVTHDIEEAILLSDRILVMSAMPGRMIAEVDVPLARPRSVEKLFDEDLLLLKRRLAGYLGFKVEPAGPAFQRT